MGVHILPHFLQHEPMPCANFRCIASDVKTSLLRSSRAHRASSEAAERGLEGLQPTCSLQLRSPDSKYPCSAAFRRRASLASLEGPQKTISLSTRRTRGSSCGSLHSSRLTSTRPIATIEAGCSISSFMLQQQQDVLFAPPHCNACRIWTATDV